MHLPKCKQIRLPGYDYFQNGRYFVTICTQDRQCIFGPIVGQTGRHMGRLVQINIPLIWERGRNHPTRNL